MRSFFSEGEIICAEVQTIFHDGGIGLHTRNLKYGKLVTGELLIVQHSLISRSRTHFILFSWGVEVILGVNGFVWVGKPRKSPDEQNLESIYAPDLEYITLSERNMITRTRNCIHALNSASLNINEITIGLAFELFGENDVLDQHQSDEFMLQLAASVNGLS